MAKYNSNMEFDSKIIKYMVESKENVQSELEKFGYSVKTMETIETKDDSYEIILINIGSVLPNSKLQIAIQRSDGNAFDMGQHDTKLKNKHPTDFSVLGKMIKIVKGWVKKYGDIYFSSSSERKRRIYKKILSRHFEVEEDSTMQNLFLIKKDKS